MGAHLLSASEREYIAQLPPLRVEFDTIFPPYEALAADGEFHGINIEVLGTLARAFGLKLEPRPTENFERSLAALRKGQLDIMGALLVTPERAEDIAFTLGVAPATMGLYGLAAQGSTVPLSRARFAIERGYATVKDVSQQYPDAKVMLFDDTPRALQAVARGEADYYYGSILPTAEILKLHPAPGVALLSPMARRQYHFGLRKGLEPLARILNKGILALKRAPTPMMQATAAIASPGTGPGLLIEPDSAAAKALQERPVWRVGAVRGMAALNDINDGGAHSGIASDYLGVAAAALGVGVRVVPFATEAEMLAALRRHELELVPYLASSAARRREFDLTRAYFEMPYVVVARTEAPLYWDLASLAGRTLALTPEHPLRDLLSAARNNTIRVLDVPSSAAAMDAVASGKADAAVEPKLTVHLRIHADSDVRLRVTTELDELPAAIHMAATASAKALVPLIDAALADLPLAERQRIERRWVALDTRTALPWRRYMPALLVLAAALLVIIAGTVWWMRRLQREVAQRRRSEERLQDIGAALPCVALRHVFDPDLRLISTYHSPGTEAFLGIAIDFAQPLLRQITQHIPLEDRERVVAIRDECLRTKRRLELTLRYQPPGQPLRWLHLDVVPRADANGHTTWTGYLADISSERELMARLEQQADARHLMLASASHELRAPTHMLSLALQAMEQAPLDPSVAQNLRTAREAARTLGQLLNEVLDAARNDHTERPLEVQAFALRDLVAEVGNSMRIWAADKGLAFTSEVDHDVPGIVMFDPQRLRQVLVNLLSNAVKYTSEGSVRLRVRCDSPGELLLRVADTGRGIAPEQLERLFTPYRSADGHEAPKEGSTGLGLSICRTLVQRMGGDIEVTSTVGHGTRFDVRLPLAAPVAASELEPGRVLICDDDDVSRILLAQMLLRRGYDTLQAADGAEALHLWQAGGIRAVITDMHMNGMGGGELIRRIRGAERTGEAHTRIVVCSGSQVPLATADTGAPLHDAYLCKPVDADLLVQTLRTVGLAPSGPDLVVRAVH